ncbi:MAG TPA: hypothetical protein VM925_28375 [Labilithrix sp.]|nr:hypothetical protein [Labilithrix sp.]
MMIVGLASNRGCEAVIAACSTGCGVGTVGLASSGVCGVASAEAASPVDV